MVAANGPDAISSALQEASDAGVKIVYVDSPANVDAAATSQQIIKQPEKQQAKR